MKINFKRASTGAGALALVSGLVLASSGVAFASTQVGWENDPNAIGTITLLDSNGVPVTTGSLDGHPFASFAVASHTGRAGIDTKGQLYAYTPQVGTNPQTWSGDLLSAGTYSPAPSGTPADVSSTGLPFVTGGSTDLSFNDYIGEFPNTLTTAGYQNLYELRFYTAGSQPADTTAYDALDIQVDPTADTWQVVYPNNTGARYPDAADTTTTTLTTNPTSPDTTSASTVNVTLNASVAAATAVPASYTGPVGTVSFFDGTTAVGTPQLVTGSGPYTASVTDSGVANPSSHNFTAKFAPYVGTGLTTSNGTAAFSVSVPAPATSTTVTATPGAFAGDTNTYDAKVDLTAGGAACPGSVQFFDGSSSLGTANTLKSGSSDTYELTNTFNSPGTHTISANFTPTTPSACAPSTGSAAPFTQNANPNGPCSMANGGSCTDQQSITATIPQGALTISTPYTSNSPLDLGAMAPNSTDTQFSASATFGKSATDPTQDILITDTRAGDLPWTAQAQASTLSDGGTNAGSQISGEDVGLAGLTVVPVPGNAFNGTASNFSTFANLAASPAVGPTDTGTEGLGNAPHDIAQAKAGFGSVGLQGTLTLNAPSSTEAGTFNGTVTFTLVGSLV